MRYLKNVSALVLLVLMFWSCTDFTKKQAPDNVVKQAALLADSALSISYFNFKSLKSSQFFEVFQPAFDSVITCDSMKKIAKVIDLEKNVDDLFMALYSEKDKKKPGFLMIVNGHFYPENLEKFFLEHLDKEKGDKFYKEKYSSYDLFQLEDVCIAVNPENSKSLIIGSSYRVKKMINLKEKEGKNEKAKSEFYMERGIKKMLSHTKYADENWVIVMPNLIKEKLKESKIMDKKFNALKGINAIELGVASYKFDKKFKFNGVAIFDNKENTKLFNDAFLGVIAIIKLSVSEDRQIVDIINKLKTKKDGTKIEVDFSYSKEEAKKLQALKKKHF